MASPTNTAVGGPYGLVRSQRYQDISLPSERPEYDKLCELLDNPSAKLSSYELGCARMEAFQAALTEAIEDENQALAYQIKQTYGKWREALLNAGDTSEEKENLLKSDAAFDASVKDIS